MFVEEKLKQLKLPAPVAVIGGGVTGKSCFNLLQKAGIDCTVFDERAHVAEPFAGLEGNVVLGAFSADHFADYGTILLSPGVDVRRACFADNADKLLTDIELFARLTDKPIIGVTGSNGKSTVVSLLHQTTLAAQREFVLCGNIGLPVLQAYLDSDDACEGYIVELSSYQLERAPTLYCEIGVWLNVSPDHLDRYEGYADYVATKAKLFAQSKQLVGNYDDRQIQTALADYERDDTKTLHRFSQTVTMEWFCKDGKIYDDYADYPLFELKDFPQIGNHHADNIMAVFAVAKLLGIDEKMTALACKRFTPLASRSVVVGEKDGVTFINDSKGTNVGATVAAIAGITHPIILIAGGQGKGQDFSELARIGKGKLKAAFLIGQDAKALNSALQKTTSCEVVASLGLAVEKAVAVAQAGDVVMLSPACASFDMFDSYLVRGEAFEQLVRKYVDE